jgi:hypothetical protein
MNCRHSCSDVAHLLRLSVILSCMSVRFFSKHALVVATFLTPTLCYLCSQDGVTYTFWANMSWRPTHVKSRVLDVHFLNWTYAYTNEGNIHVCMVLCPRACMFVVVAECAVCM